MGAGGILDALARQGALARGVGQPGEPPGRPWSQAETRERTLLVHWPAPEGALERFVPPELTVEPFDGRVWVGAAAFTVRDRRVRGLPPLPGLSGGMQVELRTYVTDGQRPGIWLFSIESSSRVHVEAAKRSHRLPARRANVRLTGDEVTRVEATRDGLGFAARLEALGPGVPVEPGSLAEFACRRDAIYTADGGRLYRADLRYSGWSVAAARVVVECDTLIPLRLAGEPQGLIAAGHDVITWPLEEV